MNFSTLSPFSTFAGVARLAGATVTTVGLLLASGMAQAQAQTQAIAIKGQTAQIQARGLDDKPFDMARLKNKVVMVFYWSTSCGVCLSHMPELRANLAGWRGKPFELVTVNVDASMADWRAYEQISAKLESVRPITLWAGKTATPRLPLTLVLNTKGQVIARHEGRIAPEAWDDVAEALP